MRGLLMNEFPSWEQGCYVLFFALKGRIIEPLFQSVSLNRPFSQGFTLG